MPDDIEIVSEEITLSELQARLKNPQSEDLFVDIRSAQEFEQGHIKGFKNCPFDDLEDLLEVFNNKNVILTSYGNQDKNKPATAIIHAKGHAQSMIVFWGGIAEWSEKQLSLVMGKDPLCFENVGFSGTKSIASNSMQAVKNSFNKINPFGSKDSKKETADHSKIKTTENNISDNSESNAEENQNSAINPAENKADTNSKAPQAAISRQSPSENVSPKGEPKSFWARRWAGIKGIFSGMRNGFLQASSQRQVYIILGVLLLLGVMLPGSIFLGKIIIFSIAIVMLFIGVTGKMVLKKWADRAWWNRGQ